MRGPGNPREQKRPLDQASVHAAAAEQSPPDDRARGSASPPPPAVVKGVGAAGDELRAEAEAKAEADERGRMALMKHGMMPADRSC